MNRKYLFIGLYILSLLIPFITIANTSGISNVGIYFFLRMAALLGIILLFNQILIGAEMRYFVPIFGPSIRRFHIIQGIIAYCIIVLHVSLYGFSQILDFGWIQALVMILPNFQTEYDIYLTLGKTAIVLLTISVFAGIYRNHPFLSKYWRKLHWLNYVVFVLIVFHSWFIGEDTHTPPFIWLYPVFIIGFFFSLFYRFKGSTEFPK